MQDVIRVGVVSSIEGAAARVTFPDRDDLVSALLPVLQHGALRTQGHWMPEVGEQVFCIFRPDALEDGFVVGSFYSSGQPAPSVGEGAVVVAGDSVHLGDADADDPVVRQSDLQKAVDDVLSRLGDIVTALNTHTHTGVVTGGGSTLAPTVPFIDPAPVSAEGSDKVYSS